MTAVKGSALPVNTASQVEYSIAEAPFKVTRVRPAKTMDQVPIATIIVANPKDPKQVLFADMFLNGIDNKQATGILGNEYTGDLELGVAIPILDNTTHEPVFTKLTNEPVVSRRARLTGTPTLTKASVSHVAGLVVA